MKYWIHPDANEELHASGDYYATNANNSVAFAFISEFERVIALLIENQQRGPHSENGIRLYHFKQFPFTVFYEEDELKGPQIFAVAHQSREPGYWKDRLTEEVPPSD
jgi:plasmid stabilization system protein ParE